MTTDTPSSSHLELASVTQTNNESDSSDNDDELINSSVYGKFSPSWILWCGLIEGFVCPLPSQTILQICDIYFGMAIYTTVFVDLFPLVEREMAMSSNQHDSSTYDPPPATHATTVNRSHFFVPNGHPIYPPTHITFSDVLTATQHALRGLKQPRLCLLYTSPSPRDQRGSRMPSSA